MIWGYILNKYLEKAASLILGTIAAHVGQNLATKAAFKSKAMGKSIATSFANGMKGGHEAGFVAGAKRVARSVTMPDVEIAHREANKLGLSIRDRVDPLPDRAKAGLRMLSEGRVDAYNKLKSRIPEDARGKAESIATHIGLPLESAKNVKDAWQSPKNPLTSNVISRFSRAKPSEHLNPGMPSHKPGTAAAAMLGFVDPGAGMVSTAKMMTQSKRVQESKLGSKLIDKVHAILLRSPAEKGLKEGLAGRSPSGLAKLKEVGNDLVVNSTSTSLRRTARDLGSGFKS